MDLDLAQVRAFVRTAQELHFGRAAGTLSISQQALSKRIARLETELGAALFVRGGGHGVGLTEAGRRFLDPARRTLAAADEAVAAVRDEPRPLRVDVWGHLYAPMRTLARVAAPLGPVPVEPGHARDLPSVAAALLQGEVDAAFGRVHPPLPPGLTHRLVRLEPVDAVLGAGHPLAAASELRPDQLGDSVLWTPGALDRLDFLRRFAERFGVRDHAEGPNLGLDHFLAGLAGDARRFALMPADAPLPPLPGIRAVPLVDPTPLYAWSLLWRAGPGGHPAPDALVGALAAEAGRSRWLEYDPARDWLPEPHEEIADMRGGGR
ncbi:LysR family transcriptional regulator [Streptomyces sp. NBC_00249]|uniref:LysR family transcriptional regulator n=1 Tax=Streptomyces sp. NBC_00249 TaxID=2975690 RepID=UPI00225847AD|nr:LysR family transcriptional regulator [Streptomyces sp. NBC_00249]MCX5195524.1 LysR family transcriptional regulator [Streptomyces sp. NBC_00249]